MNKAPGDRRLGANLIGLMVIFAIAAAAYSWRINTARTGRSYGRDEPAP
jgi:hypothetical protein